LQPGVHDELRADPKVQRATPTNSPAAMAEMLDHFHRAKAFAKTTAASPKPILEMA